MIKQLKVGKKLSLLVASLLLCLVVVGIGSLASMYILDNASTKISDEWLPSVTVSEELNTMKSDYRILEVEHMLSKDRVKKEEYEKKSHQSEKK